MTSVSLIGTVHVENGLASVAALHALLERLRPTAIFLETPASVRECDINAASSKLEFAAVGRYREQHDVTLIPVDRPAPESAFFDKTRELFTAIERRSRDYRRLVDRNKDDTSTGGFPYLNSDRCIQAWTAIYAEALETIEWIGDPRLREVYDLWTHTNELRERTMIENIAEHCLQHASHNGAFLIGAAHRKSIIEKSHAAGWTESVAIEWGLGGPLNEGT